MYISLLRFLIYGYCLFSYFTLDLQAVYIGRLNNVNWGFNLLKLLIAVHPTGLTTSTFMAGCGALRPRGLPEILRGKLIPSQRCVYFLPGVGAPC